MVTLQNICLETFTKDIFLTLESLGGDVVFLFGYRCTHVFVLFLSFSIVGDIE